MHYRFRIFPTLWILAVLSYVSYDRIWLNHDFLTPSAWLAVGLMIFALLAEQVAYRNLTVLHVPDCMWFDFLHCLILAGPFALATQLLSLRMDSGLVLGLISGVYAFFKVGGVIGYGFTLATMGLSRREHARYLLRLGRQPKIIVNESAL